MGVINIFRVASSLLDWRAADNGDGTATPYVSVSSAVQPAPASAVVASAATSLATTGATQLPSQAATIGVWVSCPLANTAAVYISDATVTTANGIELQPGDREFFPVSNANLLYARTGTATQSVRSMAV